MTEYLIEYTKDGGYRHHFREVEADSPAQAADRFIDETARINVQQVWQPVEWRV